jgi:adenine phosphoribosyltransferase
MNNDLKSIRIIKDFPKKGIAFYDISTILSNPKVFNRVVNSMSKEVNKLNANTIVGIDSRVFIFASAVAYKLKKKLVMIRKKGKLPGRTYFTSYKLEYGSNELEIQSDMIKSSDKIVIIDDIFATSGTIRASMKLIKKTKAKIKGIVVLLELNFLNGRSRIKQKLISLNVVNT